MGLLDKIIKDVVRAPGKIVEEGTRAAVSLPADLLEGLEKGMDKLTDEERDDS